MNRYYKATRVDGSAFFDPAVRYQVGKTVRPKRYPRVDARICGAGFLHAADVPEMTLVGGSWPCRLFVVEGNPVVGFDAEHPHKGGFRQLKVIEELDAWRVFGLQGEEVVELIERISALSLDEIKALNAARGVARGAARDAAWDAARDAVSALLVKDLISVEHFNLLYGPWASVMDGVKG